MVQWLEACIRIPAARVQSPARLGHGLGQITCPLHVSLVSCNSVSCPAPMFHALMLITQNRMFKAVHSQCLPPAGPALHLAELSRSSQALPDPIPAWAGPCSWASMTPFLQWEERIIPLSSYSLRKGPLCSQQSWVRILTLPLIASCVILGRLLPLHKL